MMRIFLKSVAAVAAGFALGLFATWFAVVRGAALGGDAGDGPWRTSLLTGSAQGGSTLRAAVALHGLFALNRGETIYYTATTDSAGNALDGRCLYRVSGRDPPARWWSITAYGADDYLIANKFEIYSVSKTRIPRRPGGGFVAKLRRDIEGPGEIPTGDGPFSLTLRLYNPDPAVAADPAHVALPRIDRGACS